MSPIRKEDDFRNRAIEDWDEWIEKEIRDSMARGDFADLPGHGKPIRIETNPFDSGMDMAYSRLRNAGYAPTWMELDREITAGRKALDEFLRQSGVYLAGLRAQLEDGATGSVPEPSVPGPPGHPWWAFWRRLRDWLDFSDRPQPRRSAPMTPVDVDDIRDRVRTQYLARAAELDKKIGTFHASLPPNLWHLQRMALPKDRAARLFDAHIPPVRR